jgi:hypothetical protein
MRALLVMVLSLSLPVLAQSRPSKPGNREGAKCESSSDCALGFYCTDRSVCTIGCVTSLDCADPRICNELKRCAGNKGCRKVCHLPDLVTK